MENTDYYLDLAQNLQKETQKAIERGDVRVATAMAAAAQEHFALAAGASVRSIESKPPTQNPYEMPSAAVDQLASSEEAYGVDTMAEFGPPVGSFQIEKAEMLRRARAQGYGLGK